MLGYRMHQLRLWRYGAMFSILPSAFVDLSEDIEDRILNQVTEEKDKRLLSFKETHMQTCSMTAVAVSVPCYVYSQQEDIPYKIITAITSLQGAIMAQASITAFSLPYVEETHWTVKAV